MNNRYEIVFRGNIKEGANREKIENFLAGLMKKSLAEFRIEFARQGFVTIKEDLSYEEAEKYMPILEKPGVILELLMREPHQKQSMIKPVKIKPVNSSANKPIVSSNRLVGLFNTLMVLSLLGGLLLCVIFWPGDPGRGYSWKIAAYVPSIAWLMASIVEAAIFATFSNVLFMLNQIEINTRRS